MSQQRRKLDNVRLAKFKRSTINESLGAVKRFTTKAQKARAVAKAEADKAAEELMKEEDNVTTTTTSTTDSEETKA